MEKKIILMEGMHCKHCAKKVHDALLEVKNISKVKVNLKKQMVTINVSGEIELKSIETIINDLGYNILEIK